MQAAGPAAGGSLVFGLTRMLLGSSSRLARIESVGVAAGVVAAGIVAAGIVAAGIAAGRASHVSRRGRSRLNTEFHIGTRWLVGPIPLRRHDGTGRVGTAGREQSRGHRDDRGCCGDAGAYPDLAVAEGTLVLFAHSVTPEMWPSDRMDRCRCPRIGYRGFQGICSNYT